MSFGKIPVASLRTRLNKVGIFYFWKEWNILSTRFYFHISFLSRWHSPLFLTTSAAVFPLLSVEFWLAPLINSKSMILFSPEMVKVIQFSFYSYKFVFSKINFEVYHYQQHNVAPCGHFYQPMLSKFFQNKIEWKVQYVNAVSNWKLYLHLHHF